MFHLSIFGQSIDPANALTNINAIREEQLFVNGVDLRVNTKMPNIIGAAALANDASVSRAQVSSPSLRLLAPLDVEPIVNGTSFGEPPEQSFFPNTPIALTPDEALNFAFLSDPAAAVQHYGLVWMSDGPQPEVGGAIFTVRATAAITQANNAWTNGNLTFATSLPAGSYQVVGLRVRSTDGVAARLVFPEQVARPGVIVLNAIGEEDPYWVRFGRMGVWGEFPHTNPPTLDIIGGAAAAQVAYVDLVRVR